MILTSQISIIEKIKGKQVRQCCKWRSI